LFVLFLLLFVPLAPRVLGRGGAYGPSFCLPQSPTLNSLVAHFMPAPPAVALYVAFGPAARESTFALSVRTLRDAGGWRGGVLALTDQPACVPEGATAITVSCVRPTAKHIKLLKMRAPLLVSARLARRSLILYIDADVIFAAPAWPILDAAASALRSGSASLAVFAQPKGLGHDLERCPAQERRR